MTIEAYPFDNASVTTEVQWQRMVRLFSLDGVDGDPLGTVLKVTQGTGLNVNVAGGHALLRGMFYRQVGAITVSIPANGSASARIDRIVLRCSLSANTIVPFVIEGTPATTPVAPAMTYTESIFDLPLAQVRVEAGGSISSITDRRRFIGRHVVPCLSTNRPDAQDQPLMALEADTGRVIFTKGDGNWVVGLSDDTYLPKFAASSDSGGTTSTTWTTDLVGANPVAITFTSPASGRCIFRIGAYMTNGAGESNTCMALRLVTAGGTVHWAAYNSPANTADKFIRHRNAGGQSGSTGSASFYASALTPNTSYTATLSYSVDSGTGTYDERFIEVAPLP